MDFVIARRPKADVAISYPLLVLRSVLRRVAKGRACYGAKAPHDLAHSFSFDGVLIQTVNRLVLFARF